LSVKGVTEGMVIKKARRKKCCYCGKEDYGQTRFWRVDEKKVCCNHCHIQSLSS